MKKLAYNLLYRLGNKLPIRVISDNGLPYLERYYVCTLFGLRVYLHRFVGSDPMRGWHDHPFYPCLSVVLWGEYGEERGIPSDVDYMMRDSQSVSHFDIKPQRVRWFNWLARNTAHRVVIGNDWSTGIDGANYSSRSKECWTLFVHPAEYRTAWGFWTRKANGLSWASFDGGTGTKSSGEWWKTTHIGSAHPQRQPSL